MTDSWGGWWTEAKLEILRKYLHAFNLASTTARATVYLDLFAGRTTHTRPDTAERHDGSTTIALATSPPFSRLVFWELEPTASQLGAELCAAHPNDNRWHVVPGDSNATIDEGLSRASDLRWAPTFAFIDPKGLDVAWTTLERLASWRRGRTKVEMWLLLPEPAMERVLGLTGVRGRNTAEQMTSLYGCEDGVAIHERRRNGEYSAQRTRAEYVNLLRWRLQHDLGYKITHPLTLTNATGSPVYTMVFATDHPAGGGIMHDIYSHAHVHEIPELRGLALAHRAKSREEAVGVQSLFDSPPPSIEAVQYQHTEAWEPPQRFTDQSILEELEDFDDPDDYGEFNPDNF
jgi:three-Cys-motif partner protein